MQVLIAYFLAPTMTHVQLVPYRRHIPDYSTTVHRRITPTASHMRIPCHQLFAGQFHLTFRFPRVYFTVFILQFNLVHAKYACSLSCIPSLDFSFSYSFSKQFMYTFSLAFVPTYLLQLLKYAKKTYIKYDSCCYVVFMYMLCNIPRNSALFIFNCI